MVSYFGRLSAKYKSSSLWKIFSLLKTTIRLKAHIDIDGYQDLKLFLNRLSTGYEPKQAETFTADEVQKFVDTAPDYEYLVMKVNISISFVFQQKNE